MKRTLLLLTVLFVTVGFMPTAYATQALKFMQLIPPQSPVIAADSTYAKMMIWNGGQNSIDVLRLAREFKAKTFRLSYYITDTCTPWTTGDTLSIVTKMSWQDTLSFQIIDSSLVLPAIPFKSATYYVASDSVRQYMRTYIYSTHINTHTMRLGVGAVLTFYDKDAVWCGERRYKVVLLTNGGY